MPYPGWNTVEHSAMDPKTHRYSALREAICSEEFASSSHQGKQKNKFSLPPRSQLVGVTLVHSCALQYNIRSPSDLSSSSLSGIHFVGCSGEGKEQTHERQCFQTLLWSATTPRVQTRLCCHNRIQNMRDVVPSQAVLKGSLYRPSFRMTEGLHCAPYEPTPWHPLAAESRKKSWKQNQMPGCFPLCRFDPPALDEPATCSSELGAVPSSTSTVAGLQGTCVFSHFLGWRLWSQESCASRRRAEHDPFGGAVPGRLPEPSRAEVSEKYRL